MAPTTRQQQHRTGSPIPAAGFMAPPAKAKAAAKPGKTKLAKKPTSAAVRPEVALRTAARDAEMAAKALLGLSKNLKKQARAPR